MHFSDMFSMYVDYVGVGVHIARLNRNYLALR